MGLLCSTLCPKDPIPYSSRIALHLGCAMDHITMHRGICPPSINAGHWTSPDKTMWCKKPVLLLTMVQYVPCW